MRIIQQQWKAAEQDHASAQSRLGYMHDCGNGVERDYSTAEELYRKAAEQGHADAQLSLYISRNRLQKNNGAVFR